MGAALSDMNLDLWTCAVRKRAQSPATVFREDQSEDELHSAFMRFARPADGLMDRGEYVHFVKDLGLDSEAARDLWIKLDADKNGVVDADEFTKAVKKVVKAKQAIQHHRLCPTCGFDGSCTFCVEIASCQRCTPSSFCLEHWAAHPANLSSSGDSGSNTASKKVVRQRRLPSPEIA